MQTRVVFVRLHDPSNAERVASIIRPLGDACPGIVHWEVGVNMLADPEFHVCMRGVFASAADFDAYIANPTHHEVSARVLHFVEKSVPFDYVE